MNTKEKLIAFKDIDEDILVTVAGQIPPQKRAGKIMSAGPKFWSVTDEATEGMVEANFYLCVTKDHLHFCILNSYNPDIVRRRVSFPLSEVEMTVTKEGHPNHVLLKTKDEEVTLIIPATRGLTGLKDQKECAIKFLDIVKKINN